MVRYVPRIIDKKLEESLSVFGAVLIKGPKWCGKTTTAEKFASSKLLLSDPVNDFAARSLAELEPSLAIEGKAPRMIDEWQEVPKLWDAVRFECDKRGSCGQFILTGSATPNDRNAPMHSGAGRISRINMGTMSLKELGISTGDVSLEGLFEGNEYSAVGSLSLTDVAELIVRGGWPSNINKTTRQAARLARDYIETVCESDISEIDGTKRDPAKVKQLIQSLARNESSLVSEKTLVGDMTGTASRQTVSIYRSVLKRLNFTNDIPAWSPAIRDKMKLRSARKTHLADPSLAAAALGASVKSLEKDPKTLGLLFESLVLHDLIVYARAIDATVSHYHDSNDLEVDAIVSKWDGRWTAIEVKLGSGGIEEGTRNLIKLEQKMVRAGNEPPVRKCVIVGFGTPAHVTPDGVQVIPIDTLAP